MATVALSREEKWGLAISVAGHVALLAVLLWRPGPGDIVVPPQRVEVTLSDDVAMTSTSPDPQSDARADVAPTLGDPAPAEPETFEPVPAPPEPVPEPPKPEVQKPEPRPVPVSKPKPAPKPKPKAAPKPKVAPKPAAPAKPKAAPQPKPATPAKSAESGRTTAKPATKSGGSRIGADFLEGTPGGQGAAKAEAPRAAAIGSAVRSSLSGAITRQLKPHWVAPQGADAEQLVTVLAWNLNRDGSLNGAPRVVRQSGITDANRAQASRHAEQAVRAVQLAAPFNLPDEYYDGWKRIAAFTFDKRLSQ